MPRARKSRTKSKDPPLRPAWSVVLSTVDEVRFARYAIDFAFLTLAVPVEVTHPIDLLQHLEMRRRAALGVRACIERLGVDQAQTVCQRFNRLWEAARPAGEGPDAFVPPGT